MEAGRKDEVLRYGFQICQRTENIFKDIFEDANSKESPSPVVNQFTSIFDFKGFSFYQLTCAKSKKLLFFTFNEYSGIVSKITKKLRKIILFQM